MKRGFTPRPRPEGVRWLRSDGKPNFSDRLKRREGDAKLVAKRPVYWVSRSSTILYAIEEMARSSVRALVVAEPATKKLEGLVTATSFVDYLGGGELYDIVVKRHRGSLYSALVKEKVASIMNPNPIYAFTSDKLTDIVEKMIVNNIGVVPIVFPDDRSIWGIITEHDIVRELSEKVVGKKVEEVMTKNIIAVKSSATLGEALKTMSKYGVRRLPIIGDDGSIWGMITAKHIVHFIGSHEVFNYVREGRAEEIHDIPVKVVGVPGFFSIDPKADVGEAATLMSQKKTSSLIVVDEEKAVGIITERDILYALVLH